LPIPRGHTNHFGRRYKGWLGLDWGVAIEIRHIAKQKPNRAAATSSTSHWPHPQQPRGGGGGGDLLKLPPFGCNPSTCFVLIWGPLSQQIRQTTEQGIGMDG